MENEEKKENAFLKALKWTLEEYIKGALKYIGVGLLVLFPGSIILIVQSLTGFSEIIALWLFLFVTLGWVVFVGLFYNNYQSTSGKRWRG